jgi:hypothetical protein
MWPIFMAFPRLNYRGISKKILQAAYDLMEADELTGRLYDKPEKYEASNFCSGLSYHFPLVGEEQIDGRIHNPSPT